MPQQVRIELFGGLRVIRGDQVIDRFATAKGASLLACLAYHLDRAHPREVLATLFWPDVTPKAGRTSLNDALSSLRGQLEPPGITHGSIINGKGKGPVRLNPAVVTTDVLEFKNCLKAALRDTSPDERAQHLCDALKLYRGELLPGFYDEWVITEQRRFADVYFETVNSLVTHFIQTREYPVALEYAQRAVSAEPLSEKARGHVMTLYAALNQPTSALQQYKELERLLATELRTTPSAALHKLRDDIELRLTGYTAAPVLETPPAGMAAGPSAPAISTITFLATDSDSSGLAPDRCAAMLRASSGEHGGEVARHAGAAFLIAFNSSSQALACAVACQRALAASLAEDGAVGIPIRMALHTGEVSSGGRSYGGAVVDTVRRMAAAAHGGQILCSQTTAELLRRYLPPDVQLTDMGLYRLHGTTLPERIFQVVHPELPRKFPALRLEAGCQSRLPVRLTGFFGRDGEIAHLQQLLSAEDIRLITLTGPGGAGKTRLSLEVAYRLVETFVGAVWFVPLADVSDARLIAEAITTAIGLQRSPLLEPLQQVIEAFERQRTLLLLDNFEQVAEGGACIVRTLLERVPALTCLVTSRQPLALTAEREFPLYPLRTPGEANTPETITLSESVRLFIDRAQAVRPDFQVTNQNARVVAELCNRLEGIPLAIELAAARAQTWPPAKILVQMGRPLEMLVSRKRDIEERHRTLRATIDWSYRLLPSEIQGFFARLSVFRGGWTAEAAGAVCGVGARGENYLEHLRERSLVRSEEGGPAPDAPMRFRMLETLQAYAREKVTADEQAILNRGHADFFHHVAEEAAVGVRGDRQAYWLGLLEAEHDNLRSALEWAREADPELGLRLAASLPLFWDIRGHWREGYRVLTDLLERTRRGEPLLRARALLASGNLAQRLGDYLTARDAFRASFSILESPGNQGSLALVWNSLGILAQEQGDYAEARRCLEASLAIKLDLDDRSGAAKTRSNLGYLAYLQGDVDAARSYLEHAIATLRGLGGEKHALANALNNLGGVTRLEGDYPAACALLVESLNLRIESDDRRGLVHSFDEFAHLAAAQEEPALGTRLSAAAEALRLGMDISRSHPQRERHAALIALLQEALGDTGFDEEWQQALDLSIKQAIAIIREK